MPSRSRYYLLPIVLSSLIGSVLMAVESDAAPLRVSVTLIGSERIREGSNGALLIRYQGDVKPTANYQVCVLMPTGFSILCPSSDPAQSTLVTFTPDDWSNERQITIHADADADAEDQTGDITVTDTADSGQPGTNKKVITLKVVHVDRDGLRVDPPSLILTRGQTTEVHVRLIAPPPTASSTVEMSTADGLLITKKLVFEDKNWNKDQTITVAWDGGHTASLNETATITATLVSGLPLLEGRRRPLATVTIATPPEKSSTDIGRSELAEEELRIVRGFPDGSLARFDLRLGWEYGRFADGAVREQYPLLAVRWYQQIRLNTHVALDVIPAVQLSQQVFATNMSINAANIDSYNAVTGSLAGFLRFGGMTVAVLDETVTDAHLWMGPLLEGGYGSQLNAQNNGNDSMSWHMLGGRIALGPDCWLDVGVRHDSERVGEQIVARTLIPFLNLTDDGVRILFSGEFRATAHPGDINQPGNDVRLALILQASPSALGRAIATLAGGSQP